MANLKGSDFSAEVMDFNEYCKKFGVAKDLSDILFAYLWGRLEEKVDFDTNPTMYTQVIDGESWVKYSEVVKYLESIKGARP